MGLFYALKYEILHLFFLGTKTMCSCVLALENPRNESLGSGCRAPEPARPDSLSAEPATGGKGGAVQGRAEPAADGP